jgi:phage tail sheath protein FI
MAEVLLSPGVLARETDQSFLAAQPVQAGAAILGPTVKGPVGIPTLITTYSQYQNVFGAVVESGSAEYTYFTSISAYNYFQQGGDSLLVTRVVSGSYTSAVSSTIQNSTETGVLSAAPAISSITGSVGSYTVGLTGSVAGAGATATITLTSPSSSGALTIVSGGSGYTIGETLSFPSSSVNMVGPTGTDGATGALVAGDIINQNAFVLETLSEGSDQNSTSTLGSKGQLALGTRDNIRWEIVSPNTTTGTFNLIIRRGNDTTNQKTVLETYANVSLDPNSNNYIEKLIGNSKQTVTQDGTEYYIKNEGTFNTISNYVRVKSVNSPTLNYFDNAGNAKAALTGSIPLAGSGSFGGAEGTPFVAARQAKFYNNIDGTDTQGLIADNYTISINLLANRDQFNYNLITAPGLYNTDYASPITTMINNSQFRGDNMAIVDLVPYNTGINSVTAAAAAIDTSYAATYWPWLQTIDPDLGGQVWVPASAMMPGVFAFNDRAGEAWFAPAGLNRGGLSTVLRAERALTNGNRDTLYSDNVNPIATFPNTGVVVFGQKTLQAAASALDRVNVRRLLIELKSFISQIADTLVFEANTIATRNNFLSQVNPYMESVQQRQGLYAFKVVMDESNNTPDVIDRNQMVGQIYIQPTKTAEFIYLDFNILPTGAVFPA